MCDSGRRKNAIFGADVTKSLLRALSSRRIDLAIVGIAIAAGLVCRYAALDYKTADTSAYLIPWYVYARLYGVDALGHTFTNYTPFYSYLLLIATRFDAVAAPWYLIKAISFVFEFGCALMAARLVALIGRRPHAPAIAFAAVWLAPTVLFNGALWGQADAIWTFFILLSIYLMCCRRWAGGVLAFAVAFAVKAQASFLGPFILGFVLCRKPHWKWLASIPAIYLVVAAPALLLGQPLSDVLTVYLKQSQFFHRLTMNAANVWFFVPDRLYGAGVVVGIAVAAAAGLAFAVALARFKPVRPEPIVIAAAVSLLIMPLLLPKMHDRYFYAFEVTAIVLACIRPRLIVVALAAQLNGILAYLASYEIWTSFFVAAAIGNLFVAAELGVYAWRKFAQPDLPEGPSFSPAVFVVGMCAIYGAVAIPAVQGLFS